MSGRVAARARRGASPADDEATARAAHVHGGRRAPTRSGPDRRSLATRLPVVVVLTAALAAAVAMDDAGDGTTGGVDSAPPAEVRPDMLMAASRPAGADSSTWYCAAGTAQQDGMADHTVTVLNPTGDDLEAEVTVFAGDMAQATVSEDKADGTAADTAEPRSTGDEMTGDGATTDPEPGDTGAPAAAAPAPVTEKVALPAGEQVSLRLRDLVEAPLAAALVEVDGGDVAVEHRVAGPHGADTAPCSTTAAPTWHVPWSVTTRDARDVVVLFNPFPSSATVDAVFTTEDGGRQPVRFQGFPIPPGSVVGVDLGEDVTRSEHVSATFDARSGSIVVEHLQEFDGSLGTRGLSVTPAVPGAGATWVFADGEASAPSPDTPAPGSPAEGPQTEEGETEGPDTEDTGDEGPDTENTWDGDETAADQEQATEDDDESADGDQAQPAEDEPIATERIVVYNPGDHRAEVEVSVIPTTDEPAPAPQPFRLRLGAGDYEVVDYGDQDRIAPGVHHTTVVRSTNGEPVVAERVTVDQGPLPARTEGTASGDTPTRPSEITATTGARLAAPEWRFPSLADPDVEDSTVIFTVFNPDPAEAVEVSVTLLMAERSDDAHRDQVVVPPGTAMALELDAVQAAEARAATVVADGPVVVERVVRLADGRRRTLRPGIPAADGALPLDDLAADGLVGGILSA
jgi:hypothetical protein